MSLHSMLEELELAKFGRVLPLPLFCLFCILIWAVSFFLCPALQALCMVLLVCYFSLSCFAGSLYGAACLLMKYKSFSKKKKNFCRLPSHTIILIGGTLRTLKKKVQICFLWTLRGPIKLTHQWKFYKKKRIL